MMMKLRRAEQARLIKTIEEVLGGMYPDFWVHYDESTTKADIKITRGSNIDNIKIVVQNQKLNLSEDDIKETVNKYDELESETNFEIIRESQDNQKQVFCIKMN